MARRSELRGARVAHLTTVDLSLRYLLLAQLRGTIDAGGTSIGISAPGPDVEALEAMGIRHLPLPSSTRGRSLRGDLRAALDLWRILRSERVDVLHTHNPKPGVYGRVVSRLAGVPVVVNTVHGLYATETDRWARRAVVYALEGVASRFADAELVQNPEDVETMRRFRLAPRRNVRLLGNGVDLRRFRPPEVAEERDAVRAELGVDDDVVVVGTVSRLVAEKGLPELLEAAEQLGDRCVLVVVGPADPDKADAVTAADVAAAEAGGVRFLGRREDVQHLYRGFDVFVLASHREGFPRAAMEAAASGLPVVATDIRGCRQVVRPGENGFLVPVRDPDALAWALGRLADDPELRRSMGEASRRIAAADFDEDAVVERVLQTYAELLPGRRRGRAAKRALDLAATAPGLVVASPLLAAGAALVRMTMGRPVLFRQERPGLHGRTFTLYKLRTMKEAASADGATLPDADRLTAVGRFLRRTSIDELPQLLNVLRGDMSLVGPRPLLPEYLPLFTERQARRHDVRPGITGLAQVRGRNGMVWEDRLELDAWYAEHRSFLLDLRILLATARVVLGGSGVSSVGHATMPRFDRAEDVEVPVG